MRIATRFNLFAACWLSATGFTACSSKADAPAPLTPDPTPTFELSHYFDFTTTAPGGGTAHSGGGMVHAPQDIRGTASLDATGNALFLGFKSKPDEVYLEINQAQLRPGWTGTYALRCRNRPADPASVSYLYTDAGTSVTTIMRLSNGTPELTGSVTISAYDAKRQLVSGSYEISAPNQQDPSAAASPGSPRCTVLLAGKFTSLKVQL